MQDRVRSGWRTPARGPATPQFQTSRERRASLTGRAPGLHNFAEPSVARRHGSRDWTESQLVRWYTPDNKRQRPPLGR